MLPSAISFQSFIDLFAPGNGYMLNLLHSFSASSLFVDDDDNLKMTFSAS